MNARLLLVVGSIGVNVAWAALFVTRPQYAPAVLRDFFQGNSAAASATPAKKLADATEESSRAERTPGRSPQSQALLWSALQSEDLPTLVTRLRSAGFPPALVRAIVSAEVDRRFQARMKALASTVEDAPFWKPAQSNSFNNPKYVAERQQIFRERARMLRELLGDEALTAVGADPTAAQRQQFGNLSPTKIELLRRINEDYTDMIAQVRTATRGITLPEDRAKLALLEREKRADLAGVLTPQELEDYEMRTSMTTIRLRSALTLMNATEEEFRLIYRTQQPFSDILNPSDRNFAQDLREKRVEAQKQIAAQLTSSLGEARYAEFARAQNYEFQQLSRLAQRENLSPNAAIKAFELRNIASEESQRIAKDITLSNEQKLAAMQTLAQNTRNQFATVLGPNAGPAYAQSSNWLQAIERGSVVTFAPEGVTMFRSVAPVRSTPAPRP